MPIKLNGATSGSVELDVPAAVGSDLQLTFPATAGTALVAPGSTSITVPSVNAGTLDRLGSVNWQYFARLSPQTYGAGLVTSSTFLLLRLASLHQLTTINNLQVENSCTCFSKLLQRRPTSSRNK